MSNLTTLASMVEKERAKRVCDYAFQNLIEFLERLNSDEARDQIKFVRKVWLEREI